MSISKHIKEHIALAGDIRRVAQGAKSFSVGSDGDHPTLSAAFAAVAAATNHTVLASGLTLTGEVGSRYGTLDTNLTAFDGDDDYCLLTSDGNYIPCFIYGVAATSEVVMRYPHSGVLDYSTSTETPSVFGAHSISDVSIDVVTTDIETFTFQAGDKVIIGRGTAGEQIVTLDNPPYSQGTGAASLDQLLLAGTGLTANLSGNEKVENLSFRDAGISFVKVHRYTVLMQPGEHDLGGAAHNIPPFTSIVGIGEVYLQNGALYYQGSSGDVLLKNIKGATTDAAGLGMIGSSLVGVSQCDLVLDNSKFQSCNDNQDVIYLTSLTESWYSQGAIKLLNGSVLRGSFDVFYVTTFSEIVIESSKLELIRRDDIVTAGDSNCFQISNAGGIKNAVPVKLNLRSVIFEMYNPDNANNIVAIKLAGPTQVPTKITGSIQQCELHGKAEAASAADVVGVTIDANVDVSELMIDNNFYDLVADGAGTATELTSAQAITVGKRNVKTGFAPITLGGSAVFDTL